MTITAVQPAGRFGDLEIKDGTVTAFKEKAEQQTGFINGGFFVMNKRIGKYLTDDTCVLEQQPLNRWPREARSPRLCIPVSGSAWILIASSSC